MAKNRFSPLTWHIALTTLQVLKRYSVIEQTTTRRPYNRVILKIYKNTKNYIISDFGYFC